MFILFIFYLFEVKMFILKIFYVFDVVMFILFKFLTPRNSSAFNLCPMVKFEMHFHTHYAHDNEPHTKSIEESISEELFYCCADDMCPVLGGLSTT